MGPVTIAMSVVLPLAMIAGFIAVWRMPKHEGHAPGEGPKWRDESLDEWRTERDAAAEEERLARVQSDAAALKEGSPREDGETKRHQRIGG
jgi:hypothetical protein